MRVCKVSGGMYTVKGAAELNLPAKGDWRERKRGFFARLMSHNKARSAWERRAAKRQHSTVTNLECRVSFRHCWLSPSLVFLALSCHSKKKNTSPGRENETARCRSWYLSEDSRIQERGEKGRRGRVSDRLSLSYVHPLSLLLLDFTELRINSTALWANFLRHATNFKLLCVI